jgi:hypothetical protein
MRQQKQIRHSQISQIPSQQGRHIWDHQFGLEGEPVVFQLEAISNKHVTATGKEHN